MWQTRLFRRDFLWGYIKIGEAADIGDLGADPNDILKRETESK